VNRITGFVGVKAAKDDEEKDIGCIGGVWIEEVPSSSFST
jgi:hypothetical protein